jgi:two-component system, probable response regulator PhcQ
MMRRFLIVDDELPVLHALQRTLHQHAVEKDVDVEIFTEPDEALVRCGEVDFDLVVSDYRMPGIDGIEFLRMVKAIQPAAIRIMLSASADFDTVAHAVKEADVSHYIPKPWQPEDLTEIIRLALKSRDKLLAGSSKK